MAKKEIKFGAIMSYMNIIVSIVIGFIIVPIIIEQLGTSEYGVYSLTVSLVGYLSILDFGMHNVVVRYVAKYNAVNENKSMANFLAILFIIYGFISLIVVITGSIIYRNLSIIFRNSLTLDEIDILKKLFLILLINFVFSLIGAVFGAIVIAYEKFIFSKTITLLKILLRAILILLILKLGAKSLGLVLTDAVLNLIVVLINIIFCIRELKIRIKLFSFDFDFIKSIFKYTFYVFLASISDQINWKVDALVLGIITNSKQVALYAVGMQLISFFRSFTGAISGLFLPRATKMVAKDYSNKELTDLLIKVGRYQLLIIGLLLTGFIFVGKDFINLWVGEKYLIAYSIFLIIASALIIPSCQSIGINILEAKNMHKFRAVVYLFVALLNLIITIFMVRTIGILGASISTAISLIIGNVLIINWYYSNKVGLEIKRYFKEVYGKIVPWIIVSMLICYIIFRFVKLNLSWLGLVLNIIIITVVYVFIVFFKLLTKEEKIQLLSFVNIKIGSVK